jgi:hypothetical protein
VTLGIAPSLFQFDGGTHANLPHVGHRSAVNSLDGELTGTLESSSIFALMAAAS